MPAARVFVQLSSTNDASTEALVITGFLYDFVCGFRVEAVGLRQNRTKGFYTLYRRAKVFVSI